MGTYTFVRNLGNGAFGRVVQAQSEVGKMVALKMFEPCASILAAVQAGQVTIEELRRRFFDEAKYQGRIQHPNVIRVFESDLSANPPYFVMELAEGTLAQDLQFDHTLSGAPHQALFDILAGLEGLHAQGIFHRDLKPLNILRLKNGDGSSRYAISDFGLIKITAGDATTITMTGAQGGTERYAAPELMTNFKRATARSDIYSFGVILFDIFVGAAQRVPYTEAHIDGPVGAVAAKCTKAVPARRYASIAELRSALYEALQVAPPAFVSRKEEAIVKMLQSGAVLNDKEWDRVFNFLEDSAPFSQVNDLVLRSFSKDHLEALSREAPELLMAFADSYIDYVEQGRGQFNFDYCDVIADKLTWLVELGEISIQARALISMLGLGASHNRWFAERRFIALAGPQLNPTVAERILAEVEVRGLNILADIQHLERSISVNRTALSPVLHRLWGG